MNLAKGVTRGVVALGAAAVLVPASVYACDPGHDQNQSNQQSDAGQFRNAGEFQHHHQKVLLKGTVQSVDTNASNLTISVTDTNRRASDLDGKTVTVHAVKGWVADTNNDGKHSIADVKDGDTVIVFTKRRFVNAAGDSISAAFVFDKSNSPIQENASRRSWT